MHSDNMDDNMHSATRSYLFAREEQQMHAIDACADAAEHYSIHPDALARHLIDSGTVTGRDARQLALLASDVCAMRAAMI
jgi:hypothetical protein